MNDPPGVQPNRLMRRLDSVADKAARLAVRSGRHRHPAPAVSRDVRVVVAELRAEATDALGLRLVRPEGGLLPPWRPGAHIDLVLPSGRIRQYSLCGDPAERRGYRIVVRRLDDGAGDSREVHGLRPGTPLTLRGPRNGFPFVTAPAYLFLAGGIGITPIAPMVRAAAAAGTDWRLVHTGRDRASLPVSGELAELGHIDGGASRIRLRADDEHGGPPSAAELLADLPVGAAVYCCGPPPMIDAVRRAVPVDHGYHSERFSPPPVLGGRPFVVEFADGGAVEVAADRSALDAVRAARPDIPYSCQQGFCGTCHVRLVAGATDRDTAGPGRMALCVGRAVGERVVVEWGRGA